MPRKPTNSHDKSILRESLRHGLAFQISLPFITHFVPHTVEFCIKKMYFRI